jgi:signal transduction histidine kinase/DNA-binding response OmpR family regulator
MKTYKAIYIWFFLGLVTSLGAQNIYEIDTRYPVHPLDDYLLILEDSLHEYSLDRIVEDTALNFRIYSEVLSEKGDVRWNLNAESVYWGKLSFTSNNDIHNWFLQFEENPQAIGGWMRGNGKVDLYGYKDGYKIFYKKSGVDYPTDEKEIKKGWNLNRFNLSLSKEEVYTIYIRVEGSSFGFPPFFDLVLRQPGFENYFPAYDSDTFLIKVLFGVIFLALLYHFLLLIYLRHKVYFWFSLWLFFSLITIMMSVDVGLISEYFMGNYPKLRLPLWTISSNSIWFTFWFFGRAYVNTKVNYPKLDKIILGLSAFLLLELIGFLILYSIDQSVTEDQDYDFHYLFLSLTTFSGIFISIYLATRKDKLAQYFGVGAFFATLAPALGGLWVNGIIQLPFDPFIWGVLFQVIAYSFGLVYRRQQEEIAYQLAQKEVLQAEKDKVEMQRIKTLDEVKTKFFSNISHEFRTPISLIMGHLTRAVNSGASEEVGGEISIPFKSYETIDRNAQRLKYLVDQLLDLSRLESGAMQLTLTQGGLINFIRTLVYSFENLAEKKNLHFNTIFPEEVDGAFYDKDKLEKIIVNLLSNAIKYTPESGGVSTMVEVRNEQISIDIRDTGNGLNKDEISKIFDRFYRVEGTEEMGTGIGLALTKELVDLYCGIINVDSTVGKGTSFKVFLPYTLEKLGVVEPFGMETVEAIEIGKVVYNSEKNENGINLETQVDGQLPTALVVEDNTDLRDFITESINDQYQVISAANGSQGIKLACDHIPDIIISDVMMPGINGYELCQTLKSDQKTSHIPIILLTAKAGHDNKLEGLDRGADAYVTKPFDTKELIIRMKNLVEYRKRMWEKLKSSGLAHLSDLELTSIDDQFLQSVHTIIRENMDNESFSVEDLAKNVGFSRSQLHRKIKALINKSSNQLIREIRLAHAKELLMSKSATVSEVAYAVGYSNLSYFSKSFKEVYGCLPSEV